MVVELIGGPLDGAIVEGPSHAPAYMIVSSHRDGPVYRAGCCAPCAAKREATPYYFLGYEEILDFEYPDKAQKIKKDGSV